MSNYHCYLCASDDGIQLDIFGESGRAICEMIESCLSVKIEESNAISTKICHKCAFELDACSKFVAKYKQSRRKDKNNPIKGHCSLCSEPGKIGYIFDCKDGNPANDTLHKIQEIFNDSIFNDKRRNLSICLGCRYNLDVLFDLKCVHKSTPEKLRRLNQEGVQLSELPKTKTRVVKRKTTSIPVPSLNGTEAYDTDSSSVASNSNMPYTRKRGRPRKDREPTSPAVFRNCEKCEINIESGIDMYRYHRTGVTVCKECWLAMDPEKLTHDKRKKLGLAGGEVGTRKCAILLKDVLTNPAKYENIYKVEKDEHGNTTFIVTDDSSENEEREKTPAKRSRRSQGSVASVEEAPVKRTRAHKRNASTKSSDLEDEPPAKIKDKGRNTDDDVPPAKIKGKLNKNYEEKASSSTISRTRNGVATSDTEILESRTTRSRRQSTDSEKNAKAASDAELTKPLAKKRTTRMRLEKIEAADSSTKETKTTVTTKTRKTAKNETSVVETTEIVERPIRRTRALSLSTQIPTSSSKSHSKTSRNSKSGSENESPPTKTRKTKTKSLSPKNLAAEVEIENPYTCAVCQVEYRNKLIGMEHELTHAKQPEVKLQRVAIPEIIVEEAPAESSLIEEPEEQTHDVGSSAKRRPENSENVETSVPVTLREETSTDVLAESNENEEHSEKSQGSRKSTETSADVDIERGNEEEEKNEDKTLENKEKIDEKDDENVKKNEDDVDGRHKKIEDEIGDTEDKSEDKTEETKDKSEEKTEKTLEENEDKSEKTEDTNLDTTEVTRSKDLNETEETRSKDSNETEETRSKDLNETEETRSKDVNKTELEEDKNEDKIEKTEDKNIDKSEKADEKNEDTSERTVDKNEDKTDKSEAVFENESSEKDEKIEDKTEAREASEADNIVDNETVDENNTKTREIEAKDISTTQVSDKNNDDEKIEIPEVRISDSEKSELTISEEAEKKDESAQPLEKLPEQVLNKSAETSETLNGVSVKDDPHSEVNNVNGVEKDTVALKSHAESKDVDDDSFEKSVESPDNVARVTSTSPEKKNEIQDVDEDKVAVDNDETASNLKAETKGDTTETSVLPEKNATNENDGSEAIVNDVLTEVFDLATAEVQKRLDNEPSRDEKCTTPVSETLENISREISNSADMPSLEPLVDNQSSNNQS